MKNLTYLITLSMFYFALLSGCASQVDERHQIVPVKQGEIFEIYINENNTTKQEVIDVLGTPESIRSNYLWYRYLYTNNKCKVHLIKHDGTKWNVVVGRNEKYHNIRIHFYDKKISGYTCDVTIN